MEHSEPGGNGEHDGYREDVGTAPSADLDVPVALVRRVAAELKALSKVVPYDEYASIVHRIARLKWQCEQAASSLAYPPDERRKVV
jgi:hypothetical protein